MAQLLAASLGKREKVDVQHCSHRHPTAKTGGFHPLPQSRGNGFLELLFFFPFASPGNNSDELSEAGKQKAALVSSLYPRAELQCVHGTHFIPQHLPGSLTLHQVTWWQ